MFRQPYQQPGNGAVCYAQGMRPSFFRASIAFLLISGAALTALALTVSRELSPAPGIFTSQFLPPDYAPPAVFIVQPFIGSMLTETATVTAIATDNADVIGVQFFLDAAPWGAEDLTFPYEFSWNTRAASNTAHVLQARARDAAGNRATSTAIEVTVRNTPLPPTNLTAAGIAPTEIRLGWKDNASDETGFTIERSIDGIQFRIVGGVPDDIAQFTNGELIPQTKYYYRVRAYGDAGESPYSNAANATTPVNPPAATQPAAPSALVLKRVAPLQVRLAWSDNSANEDRFRVERSAASGSFFEIAALGPNTNFYTDAGVEASTTYRYRVRAGGAATTSLYSNVASITIPQQPGPLPLPLAAPANLAVIPTSPRAIRITWQDNATGEDGFKIEHSADGVIFREVNMYPANATTQTYAGLVPGSEHFYRMRAFRGSTYSIYSNVTEVRMPEEAGPPPAPPPPLPAGGIRPFASTLAYGACNAEVTILQEFLQRNPGLYPEGTVSGCFYGRTEAAVKRFQTKYGLEPVGIVGPRTKAKLNDLYAANQTP